MIIIISFLNWIQKYFLQFHENNFSKIAAIFLLPLICFPYIIFAGSSSSSGIVLRIPFDAKISALGGAGASLQSQISAIESNPSLIAYCKDVNISIAHINAVSDVKLNGLLYSEPLTKNISFAVYAKSLRSGNIQRTELIDLTHYANLGSFSVKDSLLGVSFAHKSAKPLQLFDKSITVSYGATLKYLKSEIAEYSAKAFSTDIGFYFNNVYSPFSYGLSLLNIGNKLKFFSKGDKQPFTAKFGISYNSAGFSNFLATADIIKLIDSDFEFCLGFDYKFSKFFSVRSGYDTRNDAGLGYSLGFGLNLFIFKNENSYLVFDYAYKPYEDIGDYHFITATLKY